MGQTIFWSFNILEGLLAEGLFGSRQLLWCYWEKGRGILY